ncbi:MAG: hypothetical protein PHT34_07385 [Oscillospiraceae bacterium]|nr:hypothetical protein [Oscillospiraceae bacterium]
MHIPTKFSGIYEDNESGKITDERFTKMSASYEVEQAELAEKVKILKVELDREIDQSMTMDMFVATIRVNTPVQRN